MTIALVTKVIGNRKIGVHRGRCGVGRLHYTHCSRLQIMKETQAQTPHVSCSLFAICAFRKWEASAQETENLHDNLLEQIMFVNSICISISIYIYIYIDIYVYPPPPLARTNHGCHEP